MKILIIEDDKSNLKLFTGLLEREDYEVFEANDAETGIQLAREHQPSLILMDIGLPGMDGFEAIRILKQDKSTNHIKIVALTGFAMKGDKERLMKAGCDNYIAKPVRYKDFLKTITVMLKDLGYNSSSSCGAVKDEQSSDLKGL